MVTEKTKREETTHVRVYTEKRERAKEISRQISAKERRDVPYSEIIDTALEVYFRRHERRLGIQYPGKP